MSDGKARFRELAPELIADMVRDYIVDTDVNSRYRVRMQIKSILDGLSTDTVYPKPDILRKASEATPRQSAQHQLMPVEDIAVPPQAPPNMTPVNVDF